MHNEQVFTPEHVVDTMFEELEYKGNTIRKKHVIDNSCGDGAILRRVVKEYINACINDNLTKEQTIVELETYIHGIEIDKKLCQETIKNLNNLAEEYSLYNIKWDIINADAMDVRSYDNMMDYVIGNPPYCKIQDIPEENREKVKTYHFTNGGMADIYLVFFEIGINMLNKNGKLAYITPNSWLTSKAGTNFRKYIKESKTLLEIYQYGHYKVFENVNTYTCITILSKTPKTNNMFICNRNISTNDCEFKCTVENLDDCMIDGIIYLTDSQTLKLLTDINDYNDRHKKDKNRIRVKNGFATLNDKFFIIDEYVRENGFKNNIIEVTKASNCQKHYFFFPYNEEGKPMKLSDMDQDLVEYIMNKAYACGIDMEKPLWYLYGRTQAINDVKYDKVALNNLIRDVDDINMIFLINLKEWPQPTEKGVYSGYYILVDTINYEDKMSILRTIKTNEFVEYIKAVGKYKNGGYYTFSAKEVENWLNYVFFLKSR